LINGQPAIYCKLFKERPECKHSFIQESDQERMLVVLIAGFIGKWSHAAWGALKAYGYSLSFEKMSNVQITQTFTVFYYSLEANERTRVLTILQTNYLCHLFQNEEVWVHLQDGTEAKMLQNHSSLVDDSFFNTCS
jgi:hypothetical protein